MSYFAPLNQTEIDKAQKRFYFFFGCLVIILITIICLILIYPMFWKGYLLWTFGSYCIGISVIHSRYFDVLKISNPMNLRVDSSNGGKRNTFVIISEKIIEFIWVLGFLLVAASRWLLY